MCTGVVKRTGWGFGGQIWWFICHSLEWQRGWSGVFVSGGVVVGEATIGCCLVLLFIRGRISSRIVALEGRKEGKAVVLGLVGALRSFGYRVLPKLGAHL
ncbi:hypothetical protein H5410_026739 [Solanum commersonii]|uniref:Transmembrane protein n=1 Tax=Solanum commersonii TaxID=4109 RepID=A0A9J5YZX3_SOLCO|nr:hypothetical protein H5410_026739 [Solanum commersonii]